jgi:hypothetical protein
MKNVMKVLRDERKRVSERLSSLDTAIAALGGGVQKKLKAVRKKGKKMSEATKAKIRKAAKARWAKIKKG